MATTAQNAPKLANLRVRELKPLSSPSKLKKEIPVSTTAEITVREGRECLGDAGRAVPEGGQRVPNAGRGHRDAGG